MRVYRYLCDAGKHPAALAELTEVRPAIWLCDQHLAERDQARDTHAAQTNTTPLDETTQRLLGLWHIEQRRQKHGGASW